MRDLQTSLSQGYLSVPGDGGPSQGAAGSWETDGRVVGDVAALHRWSAQGGHSLASGLGTCILLVPVSMAKGAQGSFTLRQCGSRPKSTASLA